MAVVFGACGDDSQNTGGSTTTRVPTPTLSPANKDGITVDMPAAKKKTPKRERVDELGTATPEIKRINPKHPGAAKNARPLPAEAFPRRERSVYATSEAVCETAGPRRIARKFGISTNTRIDVASGYAKKNAQPWERDAVFAGCLAGFLAR